MLGGETRLWKLTRRQVRARVEAGQLRGALLPTGSTEQHNEHLAMEHDTASAVHVAHQASLELFPRVVVATPIPVGISAHWLEFPGTLTLRPETFFAVAYDICDSLRRHGIEHILIVNGHAGNGPLAQQMPDFRARLGIDVQFVSYWQAYSEALVREQMESGECPAHAAEFETSVALAAFPENVHWEGVATDGPALPIANRGYAEREPRYFRAARDLASAAKGRVMVDAAARWLAERMRQMLG